ncbi:MAG TPA: carboxypeptidase-like regulatory domain-containing protein, partial [Niabella sp.]|nr:carboxypeptidase-like regulatory domain-containing protein [Niabella sp.]
MKFKLLSTKAPLLVFLLIFSFQPFITSAQQVQITGKITEASGAAIGGASVMVKGTGTGTTTDAKGNYQITAP